MEVPLASGVSEALLGAIVICLFMISARLSEVELVDTAATTAPVTLASESVVGIRFRDSPCSA